MRGRRGLGKGQWDGRDDAPPLPPPRIRAPWPLPLCVPPSAPPSLSLYFVGARPLGAGRRVCLPRRDPVGARRPAAVGCRERPRLFRGTQGRGPKGSGSWGESGDLQGKREWCDAPVSPPPPHEQSPSPPPRPRIVPLPTAAAPLRRGDGTHPALPQPRAPPWSTALVGGALCPAEPSHVCGSSHMQGGTLQIRCQGRRAPIPLQNGQCGPADHRFEATPPLRSAAPPTTGAGCRCGYSPLFWGL